MRGVAVALVVVAHSLSGVWPENVALFGPPVSTSGGLTGVQLFFVLSGFLISRNVIAGIDGGRFSFFDFYTRRAARLVPALLVCTMMAAGYWLLRGVTPMAVVGEVVRTLTYTNNLAFLWGWWPAAGFMGHAWSLAVEEQFYLVWPLLLVMSPSRYRLHLALGVGGLFVLLRIHPLLEPFGYRVLRWDALMLGAALAITDLKASAWAIRIGVVVFIVQTVLPYNNEGSSTATYLLSALSSCAVLMARGQWASNRGLVFLGRTSYGIYLWHMVLMRPGLHPLLAVPASIVLATLSLMLVEGPAIAWARRFLERRRANSAVSVEGSSKRGADDF